MSLLTLRTLTVSRCWFAFLTISTVQLLLPFFSLLLLRLSSCCCFVFNFYVHTDRWHALTLTIRILYAHSHVCRLFQLRLAFPALCELFFSFFHLFVSMVFFCCSYKSSLSLELQCTDTGPYAITRSLCLCLGLSSQWVWENRIVHGMREFWITNKNLLILSRMRESKQCIYIARTYRIYSYYSKNKEEKNKTTKWIGLLFLAA